MRRCAAISEFVRKTAFGYKEVPGGHSDPDCTHVILTEDEYSDLLRKIADAVQETRITKHEAEKEKRAAKESADYRIWHAKNEAEKTISAMQEELSEANKMAEHYRGLNENLLRIAKERANAARKLPRKKDHTGYVVTYSAEREYRYRIDRRSMGQVMLWETVLQSPYSADFTEQQARTQIWEDLFAPYGEKAWEIGRLGINEEYEGKYDVMLEEEEWNTRYAPSNVLLMSESKLRLNFNQLYWELVIQHTKPLGIVPPDMRTRQN